jgi:hypothetical protein
MALRLFLVSVVAGLGLTLPNGRQIDAWWHSAQTWMNARLAELDARVSAEESEYVYFTDIAASRTETAATPAENPKDQPEVTTRISSVDSADRPEVVGPTPAISTTNDLAAGLPIPSDPSAIVESELIAPNAEPVAIVPAVSDADFEAVLDAMIVTFAADLPLKPRESSEIVIAAVEVACEQPVDPDADLFSPAEQSLVPTPLLTDADFGAALDEMIAIFSAESQAISNSPAVQAVVIETEDLDPGLEQDMNRSSDEATRAMASESARTPEQETSPALSASDDQLARAVRLTREAVFAWASLLHGPAVVTIAQ